MNRLDAFLAEDRMLPGRLADEPDRSVRLDLITESITSGVSVLEEATDQTAAANAMLAVAASHVLAAVEARTPADIEYHARQGAAWAGRAVRLAGDDPGPILYFVPRAATMVAAGMAFIPEEARRDWLGRVDGWARRVTEALERQPATVAEGTRDLIVGLTLLEGTGGAQPSEVPAIEAEAASVLESAEALLTAAGESELAAEARKALRAIY